MTPLVDYIPTGSRAVDLLYNVIDGVVIAALLVGFVLVGRRPKDWGTVE